MIFAAAWNFSLGLFPCFMQLRDPLFNMLEQMDQFAPITPFSVFFRAIQAFPRVAIVHRSRNSIKFSGLIAVARPVIEI